MDHQSTAWCQYCWRDYDVGFGCALCDRYMYIKCKDHFINTVNKMVRIRSHDHKMILYKINSSIQNHIVIMRGCPVHVIII